VGANLIGEFLRRQRVVAVDVAGVFAMAQRFMDGLLDAADFLLLLRSEGLVFGLGARVGPTVQDRLGPPVGLRVGNPAGPGRGGESIQGFFDGPAAIPEAAAEVGAKLSASEDAGVQTDQGEPLGVILSKAERGELLLSTVQALLWEVEGKFR